MVDFDEIMQLQRQLASRVVEEQEMDQQIALLEIIQSLVKDRNQQVTKAKILTVAEMEGIPPEKASDLLSKLETFGHIKKVGDHYRMA